MNFFQFAQSSKNKPIENAFASSSFIQFPSIVKEEFESEPERNSEINKLKSIPEANTNTSLDQGSLSPFIFHPKKVTFANPEASKPTEPLTKFNSILLSPSLTNAPINPSDVLPAVNTAKNSSEVGQNDEIKNNDVEITSDNLEEQMTRLKNDFKLISSWSQKQMSALQQLHEEINISSLQGNELLANINSILNT